MQIGGYRIIETIGRGSTAIVLHAVQTSLEREVAIKVLHPELARDCSAAERFLEEARLLAGLGHPHVVQVWDVGVSDTGLCYFSMRHLRGGDLAGRLAAGGIDPVSVARVVHGIASALEHIHGRGLVHRDVTPGNILFDESGAPYLTDFGVARALVGPQDVAWADLAPATVRYASPEQLRGARVDHRADIYSLGVLTYQCLTGRPPFDAEDPLEVAYAQVFDPVPRLPSGLERWQPLIEQALAKRPEDRLVNAAAFAVMVERAVPEQISGLHQAIRAPHLEHIQTVRPRDPLPGREAAPTASPALANLPTQISARPQTGGASLAASAAGGAQSWLGLKLALIAVVLAGVVAGAWYWVGMDGADTVSQPKPAAQPDAGPPQAARPVAAQVAAADSEPEPELSEAFPGVGAGGVELDDASQLPTVVDPVVELVADGRRLLQRRRLMLPSGDSAHDRFRLALSIDPGADEARQGLVDIGQAYLLMAAEADELEQRLDFWARALESTEGVERATALRLQVEQARVAERDALMARAELALAAWEGDSARSLVERALLVDADTPGAAAALELAERVGRPGFHFEDALDIGTAGPALVLIGDFALGATTVTRGEFARFRAAVSADEGAGRGACRDRESAWRSSRRRDWRDPGFDQDDRHPVVCVSVAEAESYVDWLSAQTGHRYRLPTVAEWMAAYVGPAACAAANRADSRYRENFGGRDAASCDDGHAATAAVASFAAVGLGLYDMDGNVREWTADCDSGIAQPCRERRVVGSAWLSAAEPEPASRALNAETGYNSVGFRVLREVQQVVVRQAEGVAKQ